MSYKSEIVYLLESLKKKGYTRARIESDLGYSENYIDQILSKGGNKKVVGALSRMLQNASAASGESSNELNDDGGDHHRNKSQPLSMQALADLAASNREMAEAHKVLAIAQADLVQMLKKKTTADDPPKIDLTMEKRFSDILMVLAEVGSGKRWRSIKEAAEELNKLVVAPT